MVSSAVIMADAYEKVLEVSMAEFERQRISIFRGR